MVFFGSFWVILIVGLIINILVDRHPTRRTGPRIVELALLWVVVYGGIFGLLGVYGHIGPQSAETAEQIGYAPSMFQWEVGFGDLAISVLGIMCFWWRDRWLTATVVALSVSFGGDAIGHIMQITDGNMADSNVWSMPSDILQSVLAVLLLIAYRRGLGKLPQLPRHGVVGAAQ